MLRPEQNRQQHRVKAQIVELIRRRPQTVAELAKALGVGANGIRAHLSDLQRMDVVRKGALRPGTRKPFQTFELTPDAGHSFARSYPPTLEALVGLLGERFPEVQVTELMEEVGRKLAGRYAETANGTIRERIANALDKFNSLGGMARLEEGEVPIIRTNGCPLRIVTSEHPRACRIAASMLSELIGVPIADCCEHGTSPPTCAFTFREPLPEDW